jgi:transposase
LSPNYLLSRIISLPTFNMAPRLSAFQRNLIASMIESGRFSNNEIADTAGTTDRSIRTIRRNIRVFGQASAPANNPGRPATLRIEMVETLIGYLHDKPNLSLQEMVWFIWDQFQVDISKSTISRALDKAGWSKKKVR